MAVVIDTNGAEEPLSLQGEDAERFVEDLVNPSSDPRRIEHLERSARASDRVSADKSANELFRA